MTPASTRRIKVLVADDDIAPINQIKYFFEEENPSPSNYVFEVDGAQKAQECIEALRGTPYDVFVTDINFPEDPVWGLTATHIVAAQAQFGWDTPIRIVLTGFGTYEGCVRAMRTGVWDYIRKQDEGDKGFAQRVVDSTLARLRELDFKKQIRKRICEDWLPSHYVELEEQYPGQVIALWPEPDVRVVASGMDAFSVYQSLSQWKERREPWQEPFLLRVNATGPRQEVR